MEALNSLLDTIKRTRSFKSDAALARALGVKPQTLCNWRKGSNLPDTVACAQIADLSGEPLAKVLGMIGEARAISPTEKAIWRRLAQAAGWASAAILGAALTLTPGPVRASILGGSSASHNVPHYALCALRRRLRGWLNKRHMPFPH